MYQKINRQFLVILIILVLITGLAAFLRLYQIGKQSFWLDEAATYAYSGGSFADLVSIIKSDPNMSLFYFLTFIWIKVFPNATEATHRALSAILSVASIPVVFLLGRTMSSDRLKAAAIGLIACFMVTVNAFHIEYAQEFRSYSLTFLLTSLSTYLFITAIENTDKRKQSLVWYTLITVAAVYSHFYAIFIIIAHALALLIFLFNKERLSIKLKPIILSGIGMACLLLPIIILAYFQRQDDISWVSKPTFGTVKTFAKLITGNEGEGLFMFYPLFAGIGIFFRERFGFQKDTLSRWKIALMICCLTFPVISSLFISYYYYPIFVPKYLLYIMPFLTVLAAYGIVALASFAWERKRFHSLVVPAAIGVLALFGSLSLVGVKSYYQNHQKTDWRTASQLMTTRCSDALRLYYAPYVDMSVLYYNPALTSQKADWWVDTLQSNPDADQLAASLPNEYDQVCLVLAHAVDQNQQMVIQNALKKIYPDVSSIKYDEVLEIQIYKR